MSHEEALNLAFRERYLVIRRFGGPSSFRNAALVRFRPVFWLPCLPWLFAPRRGVDVFRHAVPAEAVFLVLDLSRYAGGGPR